MSGMTPAAWESQYYPNDSYREPTKEENDKNIADRDALFKKRDAEREAAEKEKEKDRKKAEEVETDQKLQAIFKQAKNNPEMEKRIADVLREFQEKQAKLEEEEAIKAGHLTPQIKRGLINLYTTIRDIGKSYLDETGNVGPSSDDEKEGGRRKSRKSRKSRKHRKRTHRRR